VRAELGRFGPQEGVADLVERWPVAVGEAVARNAWPARIARDGTLHVNTSDSIWAFELGHRAAEIAGRLGVPKVRFTAGPLPDRAPPAAAPEVVRPTAEHEHAAAELVAGLEDENLRESVKKALQYSLARSAADRPV
jgi:hypothetical protein